MSLRAPMIAVDAARGSELAGGMELGGGVVAGAGGFHPAQAEQALFRIDLRRGLEMHRRLAMSVALCGLVLAVAYLLRYGHIYTAETLVYIQPTPSAASGPGVAMHWPYNYDPATYDSYIQQQMLSMKLPDVLKNAADRIDGFQQSGENDQDAADRLGRSLEVARQGSSYEVSIKALAGSPQAAADMANAAAAAYIESTSHEQKSGDAERLAMLREDEARVQTELAGDRTEQAALNAQLGVAAVGAVVPEHYDEDIGKLHDELVKARADRDEAEARLTAMGADSGSATALSAEADQAASADAGLTSLKQSLDGRRASLVTQMANLTPNNPVYKQDQAELAQIDASLEKATQQLQTKAADEIQEKLRSDLARTAGVESRLNGELAQMTRAAAGATPKLQRASDLAGDITRLQNRYDALDEELQSQLLEDAAPGTAYVTTAAVAPSHPAEAGVIRNSVVLLAAFLLLAMLLAVAAHKMDPRLYIASDVEQVLGFAPMAQLPDFSEVSEEVAEEHLLRLSAAIEHALHQGGLKSCIFTGTASGTGVTTVATRVRSLMEGMNRPAVLVDAAGARPTIWPAAGEPDQEAGRGTRPLGLIQRLTEEARTQDGTLVLTDAAPLAVSAETEYLARNADCAIVVMESGVTTRAQLRFTAAALQRLDVAAVGFVLNRVTLAKADAGFRNSVRAVEKHLRVASRSTAAPPVRTRQIEAEPAPAKRQAVREAEAKPPAPPIPLPAEPRPAAPVSPSKEPVPAAAPRPPAPAPPAPLPAPRLTVPYVPPDLDMPWWLADPMLQPRAAAASSPSMRGQDASQASGLGPAPGTAATTTGSRLSGLRNLLSAKAEPATPTAAELPAAGEERRQQERVQDSRVPDPRNQDSRNQDSRISDSRIQGSPVQGSRLRNPGIEETVFAPVNEKAAPAKDQGTVFVPAPKAYDEPQPQAEPEPRRGRNSEPTREVLAVPEILPPRKTREQRLEEDASARRDRRDTLDDVAVLPSWRGQYRRKS